MVSNEIGTDTMATSASTGEIQIITDQHADQRQRLGDELVQRLLQALGDVVDVVGDPAEQVAALLAVDVRQGQAVELVLDRRPASAAWSAG